MKKESIFQDLPELKRIEALKENAVKSERMSLPYYFSKEELDEMRENHTEMICAIDEKEQEKKEYMAQMKAEITPLKNESKRLRSEIKAGKIDIDTLVYLFDDQEERTMKYYDQNGTLVYQRPLQPSERQLRVKTDTGTNG